jgi:hypothetical protein
LDEGLSLFAQVVGLEVFDPVETDFVVEQAYMGGNEVGVGNGGEEESSCHDNGFEDDVAGACR